MEEYSLVRRYYQYLQKPCLFESQSNAWMENIALIFNRARDRWYLESDENMHKVRIGWWIKIHFLPPYWWLLTQSDNTPNKIVKGEKLIFLLDWYHKNGKIWHLIYQLLGNSILYWNAKKNSQEYKYKKYKHSCIKIE